MVNKTIIAIEAIFVAKRDRNDVGMKRRGDGVEIKSI